jgi:CRISPR-associated protein Cas5t
MECLRVKLYTPTGIFKNPLSIKGIEVYPLPPYSTIIGLIYRAMGRKWNEEYFQISIQGDYETIYRDYVWFKKYDFKEKKLDKLPLQVPILYNLRLLIHIKASEELLKEIENGLKEPKELLFLSGGEYPVKVEEVKRVRCEEKNFSKFNPMELVYNAYVPSLLKREIKSTEEGVNFHLSYFYKNTKPKVYNWIEATYLKKGTLIYKGKLYVDEEDYPVFLTPEIPQTETEDPQQDRDYVMFYPNNWLTASACVGMLKVLKSESSKYKDENLSGFVEGNKVKIDRRIWDEMPYLYAEYLCELNKKEFINKLNNLGRHIANRNAEKIGAEIYNVLIGRNITLYLYRNSFLTNNFKSEYKQEIGNKFLEVFINLNKPIEKLTGEEKNHIFEEVKTIVKQKFAEALEREIREIDREAIRLTCSFCNQRKAINFVKERNFTPLFASLKTMGNFFWDRIPICKECVISLFFSCISFVSSGEHKKTFIYIPQNLEETYRINTTMGLRGDVTSRFYSLTDELVEDEIQKAKWVLESIYFVEFETKPRSNDVRIYSFHIPDRVAQAIRTEIKNYPEELRSIFSEFMFYINTGKSLYDFLLYLLLGFFKKESYENLKDDTVDSRIVNAGMKISKLERLLFFINFQEVLNMNEQRGYIEQAFNEGKKLRSYYITSEDDQEKIEALKKLEGLTYKLLEAIRRKDREYFIQNLIRAYLRVEKEIPYLFKEALYDENFNMIASAFLIGLNCEVRSRGGQTNNEGEEGNSNPA